MKVLDCSCEHLLFLNSGSLCDLVGLNCLHPYNLILKTLFPLAATFIVYHNSAEPGEHD